jgi:hypothetical protein
MKIIQTSEKTSLAGKQPYTIIIITTTATAAVTAISVLNPAVNAFIR